MTRPGKLPIGIGTTFDYSIAFAAMCPMIARAGFRAITIGGGDVAHSGYHTEPGRQRIRQAVQEAGLAIDSIHAPFGPECDISLPDEKAPVPPTTAGPLLPTPARSEAPPEPAQAGTTVPAGDRVGTLGPATPDAAPTRTVYRPSAGRLEAIARVKNAIDAATALDSQIVIIHPTGKFAPAETRARIHALKDSMSELIPYAAHRNVRLAVENLPSLLEMQVFEAILEEVPQLGVCYDSSHAHLSGNTFGVLQRHKERIVALHISDSDGRSDQHLLPFEGAIEWQEFAYYFVKLLHINTFTLEVEVRESAFKDTKEFLVQAFQRAQQVLSLRPT
jgi:hypothetical protein